jgi:hypothetical protein
VVVGSVLLFRTHDGGNALRCMDGPVQGPDEWPLRGGNPGRTHSAIKGPKQIIAK